MLVCAASIMEELVAMRSFMLVTTLRIISDSLTTSYLSARDIFLCHAARLRTRCLENCQQRVKRGIEEYVRPFFFFRKSAHRSVYHLAKIMRHFPFTFIMFLLLGYPCQRKTLFVQIIHANTGDKKLPIYNLFAAYVHTVPLQSFSKA